MRHVTVERVALGDGCDRVEIEHNAFDANGQLVGRVVELRRCGVTDRRAEYTYDFDRGVVSTRVYLDLNHDDEFDVVHRSEHPMTEEQRTILTSAGHRLADLPRFGG